MNITQLALDMIELGVRSNNTEMIDSGFTLLKANLKALGIL